MLPNTSLPPPRFSPILPGSAASLPRACRGESGGLRQLRASLLRLGQLSASQPHSGARQPHSGARQPRPRGSHLPAAGAGRAAAPGGSASAPRGSRAHPPQPAPSSLAHSELAPLLRAAPGAPLPARRSAPLQAPASLTAGARSRGAALAPLFHGRPEQQRTRQRLRGGCERASARCRPPGPAGSAAARAWRRLVCRAPPGPRHPQAPPGPRAAGGSGGERAERGRCARVCARSTAGCAHTGGWRSTGVLPNSAARLGKRMANRSKANPRLLEYLELEGTHKDQGVQVLRLPPSCTYKIPPMRGCMNNRLIVLVFTSSISCLFSWDFTRWL